MFRIKNRVDMDIALEHVLQDERAILESRIGEIIDILNNAYGEMRTSGSMGGYVFLFESCEDYLRNIQRMMDYYHLKEDEAEYIDDLGEKDGQTWYEQLFLIGSDDSLVFVYPKEI